MIAFFVAMEGLRAWAMPYTEVEIARVLLEFGVIYAAWFGRQWAITLLALSLPLVALISFTLGLASQNIIGFTVGVLMAGLYGWLFLLFVKSESLNAFFRHQGPPPAAESPEDAEPAETGKMDARLTDDESADGRPPDVE